MGSASFKSYIRGKEAPRALLFYVFLIALLYAPVVFSGKTLLPGNYYPHGVIESWPYGYEGRNSNHTLSIDLATPAYFEFPMNKLVGEQYKDLTLPLWNPYQGAGTPLAAQYSSKVFFPYQILEDISPVWMWDFFLLGRLLFAGIVTFLFLRAISLSFSASFLGGLFYMFSGTFVWFINLEQMVNVAMVAPLLLLSMEALARRGRLVDIAVSAVTFALVLLAGQPETALYVLFLGALYYGIRLLCFTGSLSWNPGRAVSRIVVSFIIGFFLAAPVVVPFVELWANAHHIHPAGGDMGVRDANPVERALNILTPTFNERPLDPLYSGHPLAEVTDSLGKPNYSKFFPNNGEWDYLGGYSGIMMIFISLAGVIAATLKGRGAQKTFIWFFFGFGLAVVLKNFGVLPFLWLGKLPLFDQVWSQRWAGPVWTLSLGISGALGFEILKDSRKTFADSSYEASRGNAFISFFYDNRLLIWGLLVHAVLFRVSLLAALSLFAYLTKVFSGEPLPALRVFAIENFFSPALLLLLLVYVVSFMRAGHKRTSSETPDMFDVNAHGQSARLTLRGYQYLFAAVIILVNLLVGVLSVSGLVDTSADVYVGGIEVFMCLNLSFLILAVLILIWKGISLSDEVHDTAFTSVVTSAGAVLLFYFYAFSTIKHKSLLYTDVIEPYYFPSILMGQFLAVAFLVVALILALYFIRTSKGIYALIGLAILELWFVIPRNYDYIGLIFKLVPFGVGVVAVIFMALKWWRAFAAAALTMLAVFLWLDKEADYGFPERYDPFTPAPYVEFIKSRDGFYRSIGSYGVLFPNYASSVGIHDVRFINSLAIGAFQDYRIEYLHTKEVSRKTSSALWFTGRPELHVVAEDEDIDIGKVHAEDDFKENLKFYSMLSVKYFMTPVDKDNELEIDMRGFPLIYDKEVKIYENRKALPRAYVVHEFKKVEDKDAALKALGDEGFDPRVVAIVEEDVPMPPKGTGASGTLDSTKVKITAYDYDRVEINVELPTDGMLVLTDAWYPGWRAYVDGVKSPTYRVNSVLRGVALTGGEHRVIFDYSPRSFKVATALFLLSLLGVVILVLKDRGDEPGEGV